MSTLHRLKSGLITMLSFLGTAIISVAISNPEALNNVLQLVQDWLGRLGLPTALTFFVALVVNEVVRQILNHRKIRKENLTVRSMNQTRNRKQLELY